MSATRVVFVGAQGRMGRALIPSLQSAEDIELVAALDVGDDLASTLAALNANVAVDFTTPASAQENAETILDAGVHAVIGTTGIDAAGRAALDARARKHNVGILVVPNFSLGSVLLQDAAARLAAHFPRAEIIESHHEGKLDAPSGTARHTAERMVEAGAQPGPMHGDMTPRGLDVGGVRVHSLRLPGIHAAQEVRLSAEDEGLVLRHEAYSRRCYVPGLLLAIRAVPSIVGLQHGLESIL